MIYKTQDFAGYAYETQHDYPRTLQDLKNLLEKGVEDGRCAKPLVGYETELPFLPIVNAKQLFCVQPQVIAFEGGKGLRYVTYYTQSADPAIDWFAFYTFQGLTDDGQYFVSASLPVSTGVLPADPPGVAEMSDMRTQAVLLEKQVSELNGQPAEKFGPSLALLDQWIGMIRIENAQEE